MEKNRPSPIRDLLKETIENIHPDKKPRIYKEDLMKAWKQVVGKGASKHSAPAGFKKGMLLVDVDSPTWIYQLNIKKKKIEESLGSLLKQGAPLSIRLRAGDG